MQQLSRPRVSYQSGHCPLNWVPNAGRSMDRKKRTMNGIFIGNVGVNTTLTTSLCAQGSFREDFDRSNSKRFMRLPGGEYWWLRDWQESLEPDNHSKKTYAIHGEQFVLERRGTPRLTEEEQTRALAVFVGNMDLVPVSLLSCENSIGRETEEYSMVLIERPDRENPAESECYDPKSPRRTQRVSFTCKLCLERNVNRPVNPDAWKTGSVFIKCGCGAVHKMKDNLKIFHELQGDVFPPVDQRENFLVRELLDRIREVRDMEE